MWRRRRAWTSAERSNTDPSIAARCIQFSSPVFLSRSRSCGRTCHLPSPFLFRSPHMCDCDMRPYDWWVSRDVSRKSPPAVRTTTIINNSTGIINGRAGIYRDFFFFFRQQSSLSEHELLYIFVQRARARKVAGSRLIAGNILN